MCEHAHDAEPMVMCSEDNSSEYHQDHQILPLHQHTDSWLNLDQGSPRVVSSGFGYRHLRLTHQYSSFITRYRVSLRFACKFSWPHHWNCSKLETHLFLFLKKRAFDICWEGLWIWLHVVPSISFLVNQNFIHEMTRSALIQSFTWTATHSPCLCTIMPALIHCDFQCGQLKPILHTLI